MWMRFSVVVVIHANNAPLSSMVYCVARSQVTPAGAMIPRLTVGVCRSEGRERQEA
jgi:hypothetical protein